MTQGPISTEQEHTRPGRIIHLALIAAIFVYALVVELCESQLAPFDGFLPEVGILSALRVVLAVIGLAELSGEGMVAALVDRIGKWRAVGFGIALSGATSLALPVLGQSVPGALMGLSQVTSALGVPGTYATLVVWRWDQETPDLVPQRIVIRGRIIYDAETLPIEVPFGRTAEPATAEEGERWLATL